MHAVLDAILNKGGAGTTISRQETVDRINPLIEAHARLLHAYASVQQSLPPESLPSGLNEHLRTARMDVGKLAETVYSTGGVAYTGTDLEPGTERFEGGTASVLKALAAREEEFLGQVRDELKDVDHHIRTRAILGNVEKHTAERLDAVREAARKARD
ncbi:MAG TPA: hypothetical protein VD948_10805 [Rhodothermales bacterium]|nr:hypothetical protein [Rhodothermales bacterium]